MSESACRYCGECGRGHVCEGMYHAEIKKWTSMYHAAIRERDEARTQFELESKATVHFRQMADRLQTVIDGDKVSKELARVLNKTAQERDEARAQVDALQSEILAHIDNNHGAEAIIASLTQERDLAQKAFDEENTIRIAAEVERDEWIDRAHKCGAAWDEEVTKLKVELAEARKDALYLPQTHDGPDDCITYYDGCHCTVLQLEHNIKRAEKAEAEIKRLQDDVTEIDRLTGANMRLEAEVAAMREMLTTLQPWVRDRCIDYLGPHPLPVAIDKALATDAGRKLLTELTALRKVEEVAQMVADHEGDFPEPDGCVTALRAALTALVKT